MLKTSLRKSGNTANFDENLLVPIDDFKQCLKAFSIKVQDKDLKQYERSLGE